MSDWEFASDGLRARLNGEWARQKLEFIDTFGPPALDATARKLRRVYVDLFAGPGLNLIDHFKGEEFEAGALRSLTLRGNGPGSPAFTTAHLVNLDPGDHQALVERVERAAAAGRLALPRADIHLINADANRVIGEIMSGCHVKDYHDCPV